MRSKNNIIMANKNKTEDQFAQVEQALSKTEQYIEDNKNSLMIIVAAILFEKDEGSKYDLDVSISVPLSYSLLLHKHFQNQR